MNLIVNSLDKRRGRMIHRIVSIFKVVRSVNCSHCSCTPEEVGILSRTTETERSNYFDEYFSALTRYFYTSLPPKKTKQKTKKPID